MLITRPLPISWGSSAMARETNPKAGSTGLAPGRPGPAGIMAYDAQRTSSSQGTRLDGAQAVMDSEVSVVRELRGAVDWGWVQSETDPSRAGGTQGPVAELGAGFKAHLSEGTWTLPSSFEPLGWRAARSAAGTRAGQICLTPGSQWAAGNGGCWSRGRSSGVRGADWSRPSGGFLKRCRTPAAVEAPKDPVPKASGVASLTTPTRGTGVRPMTPILGARHTSRSVQPPTGPFSSRMVPFPPPAQGQMVSAQCSAAVSGATLVTDPYVVNSPADQHGIVGNLAQVGETPSPGQPKTPNEGEATAKSADV